MDCHFGSEMENKGPENITNLKISSYMKKIMSENNLPFVR